MSKNHAGCLVPGVFICAHSWSGPGERENRGWTQVGRSAVRSPFYIQARDIIVPDVLSSRNTQPREDDRNEVFTERASTGPF